MEKRNILQLVLNEIKKDYHDPTILPCKFVVLDFDVSLNNVKLVKEVALEGGKTLLNKPIVARYHQVSEANADDDNFGSHEEYMSKDKHGKPVLVRDTVALGVFTSEGYLEEINIDGQIKEAMVADGVLWYSKYKDACDLLLDWYERGIKINSSCEYLYKNYSFIDGIEHHHSPIIFESHAILASENRGKHEEVTPAYETATMLSLNELHEFNKLVAQAVNQAKEETTVDKDLNEELESQSNESTESTESTDDTSIEDVEVQVETDDTETLLNQSNEVSYDNVRKNIRQQIKEAAKDGTYVWVSELFETYAIVSEETFSEDEYDYKYFKYDYARNDDVVTVDLESKTEVVEKRVWEVMTNELQTQLDDLTTKYNELEGNFNNASDTIVSLNSIVEELKPYREQFMNEQRGKLLEEKSNHFSAKFEAIGALEQFESEEVKTLIAQSIEDTDAAKEALLTLNTMIVDLIQEKQANETQEMQFLGLASYRKDLVKNDDSFESRYKVK